MYDVPPPTSPEHIAAVRRLAAKLLRRHGWIGRTPTCPTCGQAPLDTPRLAGMFFTRAVYAANEELFGRWIDGDAVIRSMGFTGSSEAHQWSEAAGRTIEDLFTRLEVPA